MATLATILGITNEGRSMGGKIPAQPAYGFDRIKGKKIKTAAEAEAEAAAARTVTNEGILAELGIDTIIGSKRKKNKRYNAATDIVEANLLGE